jgi:oligopeptide/dipeptide ABC transporter ATP-binding protein
MTAPTLIVDDLHVSYRSHDTVVPAVRGVSFALRPGERFGIVGESGSGKSTLALALLRVLAPSATVDHGRIVLDGRDILRLSAGELRAMRWQRIALIPQGSLHALNPVLRVGEQIADAIEAHTGGDASRLRILQLLSDVGLSASVVRAYPHELSGGMRQRACIAMAIALGPAVLVADEPTSALDVVTQRLVAEMIMRVHAEIGAALILIGHDLALQAQVADRIAVMYGGRIVEEGPVRGIFRRPVHPYTRRLLAAVPSIHERKPLPELSARSPFTWRGCALGSACGGGAGDRHEVGPDHYVRCDGQAAATEVAHVG